jgi:hypothetical protein
MTLVVRPNGSEGQAHVESGSTVADVKAPDSGGPQGPNSQVAAGKERGPLPVPADILPLVEDAIRLIVHLTGNGENPRPEIISAVLAAKKAMDENSWSIETSTKFLEAFSELAKQAKPITAKSLSESESLAAKSSIKRWSVFVWILLPFLMVFSALSYSNSRIAANADQLIIYSYKVETPGFVPPIPSDSSNTGAPQVAGRSQNDQQQEQERAHIDAIKETTAQMTANGDMLVRMSLIELFLDGADITRILVSNQTGSTEVNDEIAKMRVARGALKVVVALDGIIYGVLNTYILPLLCALLGAAAYGLRSLSEQTLSRTYRASYGAYARAILAVIVGFAVGLFSDFTAKLSLQPLAAAFLAGYAVESFFIFLDTILQAVQKPRRSTT